MNDPNTLKWGVLLSAVSIAFGWFLNQLSGWWRIRRDDKRILKRVLYNLFEVHHILNRFDIKKTVDQVTKKMAEKISFDSDSEKLIKTILEKEIASLLSDITVEELRDLENKYQNSISELSQIEPIRAYYLSDKVKILDKINIIRNWLETVDRKYPSDNNNDIAKDDIMNLFSSDMITTSLNEIRVEIRAISWKINPIVWVKAKKVLVSKDSVDSDLNKRLDVLINNILSMTQGS